MKDLYRQGDVLLKRVDEIPENAKAVDTTILAEGEATGHKHRLTGSAQVYELGEERYVKAGSNAALTHEEHKPLAIEQGMYAVIRERELHPFDQEIRRVMD